MRKAGERARRRAIKKEMGRTVWKIVLTCVIVCIVTYAAARAVTGDEKQAGLSAKQYAVLEEESVRAVKEELRSHYLSDAGVMLTKTGEAGKRCVYRIQIHHKGLARLDVRQQEILSEEIHKTVERTWGMPLTMAVNEEGEGAVSYRLSLTE